MEQKEDGGSMREEMKQKERDEADEQRGSRRSTLKHLS